jgi:CheY-like chemotaxis protein
MAYKPRILVVESDPLIRRQIESTLRVMGAEPRSLMTTEEAVTVVNQEKFDGAFIDWDSPQIKGEELTKLIRTSRSNKGMPIAMLTTRKDTRGIAAGFKAGITFFLSKPVGTGELARLLNASRGAMLQERRRYQRVPVRVPMECKWGGKQAIAQTINMSASGLLAMIPTPPEVGAEITCEFALPKSQRTLRLRAAVVRVAPGNHVGLKFLDVADDEQEQLRKYLNQAGGLD